MTNYTFSQLIDFTRTTPGTFVGSNGLIQTTPQSRNLLTFTQEFDNGAWQKGTGVTVTANTGAAPDGTNTADSVAFAAGGASQFLRGLAALTVGVVYTYSIYVRLVSGTPTFTFDVGNGTPSGAQTPTASWQRFSFTFTFSGANQWVDIEASAAGTLQLWGAQLEQASTATDYTRNVGGLFPPRFDYDPVTLAPRGILIEEQRTNLTTYSEQFDNSDWSKSRITPTANSTVAPDGALAGDTLTATTGTSDNVLQTKTLTAVVHTFSIYLRATATATTVNLGFFAGSFLASSVQVLSGPGAAAGSGLVGVSGLSTTQWTRVSVTTTSAVPAGPVSVIIYPGGGATAGAAIVAWGAQLEAGAFATSYIQTLGNPGGVTRAPDQASIVAPMFAPWFNAASGTFVAEAFIPPQVDGGSGNYYFSASNGTAVNVITAFDANGTRGEVVTGGTTEFVSVVGSEPTSVVKMALAYSATSTIFAVNGTLGTEDGTVAIPTVNRLILGTRGDLSDATIANGYLRRITYYPVRLSNLQLQALTA
jgi:hypothetical protein